MANPSQWPNANPPDPAWAGMANELNAVLNARTGSDLRMQLLNGGGFSASYGVNFESLTPIDQANGIFGVDINGFDFVAPRARARSRCPSKRSRIPGTGLGDIGDEHRKPDRDRNELRDRKPL